MKNSKRLWTILLALALALSMMPAAVFATEDDDSGSGYENETMYTVTFDANGGDFYYYDDGTVPHGTIEWTVHEGDEITSPSNPERDWYVFRGWSLEKNGDPVDLDYGYPVYGDMTLYAIWAEAVKISLDANEGYFDNDARDWNYTDFDNNDRPTGLYDYIEIGDGLDNDWPDPKKDPDSNGRYAFDGWARSKDADAETVELSELEAAENETFYAKWTTGYEITYDANGKGFYEDEGGIFKEIIKAGSPVYDGYYFRSADGKFTATGWSLEPDGEAVNLDEYIPDGDTTFYAIWTEEYTLTLNPEDGYLRDKDVGEKETKNLKKGDSLDEYATKSINVGGNNVKVLKTADVPQHDTKAFAAWYLDSAKTEELAKGETIEKNTELYAGFTDDFYNVTFNANGGSLHLVNSIYETSEEITLRVPRGMAVDMSGFEFYNDEELTVGGFYTDEECTNRINEHRPSEGGRYIIPDGNMTIYAKWRKPIGDFYIDLSDDGYEGPLYTDKDHILYLSAHGEHPEKIEYNVRLEANYLDGGNSVPLTNSDDNTFYTISDNEDADDDTSKILTLHMPAIGEQLDLSKDLKLDFTLEAVDPESGDVIYTTVEEYGVRDPYENYQFERSYDGEKMLIGRDYFFVDKETEGYRFNSDNPEGEEFYVDVIDVKALEGDAFKISKEDGTFFGRAVKSGKSVIEVSFRKQGSEEIEKRTFKVEAADELYTLAFEPYGKDDYRFLVSDKLALKATATRETVNGTFTDGFTFRWEEDPDWNASVKNIGKVTPRDDDSIADVEVHGFDDMVTYYPIKVTAIRNGKEVASGVIETEPKEEYYEIKTNTYDKYLGLGKSVKITPQILYHSCENREEYPNGEDVTAGFNYLLEQSGVSAKDSKGNAIENAELTPWSLEEEGYDGDLTKGPFTITREAAEDASAAIYIYDKEGNCRGSKNIGFEDLYDVAEWADIEEISAVTYNGKKHTPKITVYGWLEEDFKKDRDYTISYGANTNAGKGSVTITGKGRYYGKLTKSFTIKALKITPAVTLSKTSLTYNGKAQKPKVTVKHGKTTLPASQYKVTWSKGLKNVGAYTATVTLKGNYSGKKAVSYNIVPKGAAISKLTGAKRSFTASWKKQAARMSTVRVSGYQLQYSTKKNFKSGNKTVTVAGWSKSSRKISGLKAKTTYYARVRTYTKVGKKTYYSGWSAVKKVRTK